MTRDVLETFNSLRQPFKGFAPASAECHAFFDDCMRLLADHVASSLRRKGGYAPQLIAFRDGPAMMGAADVAKAVGGTFGDERTKEATARVHRRLMEMPFIRGIFFCCEIWTLSTTTAEALPKSIADHPDRKEAVMFNMLYRSDDRLMQITRVYLIKRGARPGDAELGDIWTADPMAAGDSETMRGRFVASDPENDQ